MDPSNHHNSSSSSSNGHESGIKQNDLKGISVLLSDMKCLQLDGTKSGDLLFFVGKEKTLMKAHSLVVKSRCRNFKGETKVPNVNRDVFNVFLTYLYQGKLDIGALDQLYPLYLLSMEFGLEDLTSTCEDLIVSNLDKNWALSLLKETVETLQQPSKSPNIDSQQVQRINDTVIAYLSDNYQSLKVHKTFLDLPVPTMTALLKSPNLCVEEEEVWRCVLRWAQHKASVDTHLSQWSEDERQKVSHYLTPVISHVRLLLIDSRVFAEEVEPTGCVPMALSLERYRHAALSADSVVNNTDPRLTPRNAQKLFLSSLIINNERVPLGKKLVEWHNNIGSQVTNWKCIYRASLHGQSAEDFHRKVDGIGPTYTVAVLKNTKWVCGGYTDVPWNSSKSPKYFSSNCSFLFAFCPSTHSIRRFNVNKKHFAVCHDANSGPIFGAGADLYISSMCQSNTDSYSNLPHSYEFDESASSNCDENHDQQTLFTPSYHFSILDYEVFSPN